MFNQELKMKSLKLILIFLLTIPTANSFWGNNTSVKLPQPIEISGFVPVEVEIGKKIKNGDELKLFVNNELALSIKPKGENELSKLSTRIRAISNPTVAKVEITYSDGTSESAEESSSVVNEVYQIPSSGDKTNKHKLKAKNGKLRMLYLSGMNQSNYLKNLLLDTDKGDIEVTFTPIMSGRDGTKYDSLFPESIKGKPMTGYFELQGNFNSAKLRSVMNNR